MAVRSPRDAAGELRGNIDLLEGDEPCLTGLPRISRLERLELPPAVVLVAVAEHLSRDREVESDDLGQGEHDD